MIWNSNGHLLSLFFLDWGQKTIKATVKVDDFSNRGQKPQPLQPQVSKASAGEKVISFPLAVNLLEDGQGVTDTEES